MEHLLSAIPYLMFCQILNFVSQITFLTVLCKRTDRLKEIIIQQKGD